MTIIELCTLAARASEMRDASWDGNAKRVYPKFKVGFAEATDALVSPDAPENKLVYLMAAYPEVAEAAREYVEQKRQEAVA
jgi:hypothetical protein